MLIESNEKYIPSLISLWHKAFGDDEEYIKLFFDKAYYDCECFAEIVGDEAVSAFYLLKCSIKKDGRMYNGRYLYAAATLPEYRSKGLMSKLIKEALDYGKSKALSFIALVPADDGLYDYYSRFGFYQAMYKYSYAPKKDIVTLRAFAEITDCNEFIRIRNSYKGDMLIYNDVCNEYAFDSLRFAGTRIFYLNDNAYYAEGEELFCSDEDNSFITDTLINNIRDDSAVYTNCNIDSAEKIRNGMIYCFDNEAELKDIYMNIALD